MTATPPPPHIITAEEAGARLDHWLAARPGAPSRSRLQQAIRGGAVTVNGATVKSGYELREGDAVLMPAAEERRPASFDPSDITLEIAYEDDAMLIVNKPAGLVVHPAPGHSGGTLVNALLAHCGPSVMDLGGPGRCGLVHRLDAATTGLLIAAKTDEAHERLSAALQQRLIMRRYLAVVSGSFNSNEGEIDRPIARRPTDRKRMGIVPGGRPAKTSYRVLYEQHGLALLLARLHTGRTHQIRVHFQSLGRPVLGDPEYGWTKQRVLIAVDGRFRSVLGPAFPKRQMLHAAGLRLRHPLTDELIIRVSPPPPDMQRIIDLAFGPQFDLPKIVLEELESTPEPLPPQEPAAEDEDGEE